MLRSTHIDVPATSLPPGWTEHKAPTGMRLLGSSKTNHLIVIQAMPTTIMPRQNSQLTLAQQSLRLPFLSLIWTRPRAFYNTMPLAMREYRGSKFPR